MTDPEARDEETVVAAQRRVQEEIARADRRDDQADKGGDAGGDAGEDAGAMQAGARDYPVPPFPEQL